MVLVFIATKPLSNTIPKRCIASKQNPVGFGISDSILCSSVNISIWKYFMVRSNLVKY